MNRIQDFVFHVQHQRRLNFCVKVVVSFFNAVVMDKISHNF